MSRNAVSEEILAAAAAAAGDTGRYVRWEQRNDVWTGVVKVSQAAVCIIELNHASCAAGGTFPRLPRGSQVR